jgi:hypothetical protein
MDDFEKIQDLLFKNKKLVPEGDYIKMMEHLTKIYHSSNPHSCDVEYECPHCSAYISGDELEVVE